MPLNSLKINTHRLISHKDKAPKKITRDASYYLRCYIHENNRSFIIFILLAVFCSLELFAKELKIESFDVLNQKDLTAQTYPQYDLNGNLCAVIKVTLPEGVKFEGNVILSKYDVNEYVLYVSPGTKIITLKYPGYETLYISFPKYNFTSGLEAGRTYRLKLEGAPREEISNQIISGQNFDYQNTGVFILSAEPTNAEVLINGLRQNLDSSGKLQLNLPWGNHTYRINANKYYSIDGQFKLDKKNSKIEKNISLKPKFGFLTVNTSPEMDGAEVKVDGSYLGTLPISHRPIDNGPHLLTIYP